jgi:plastocyanin
MLRRHLRLAAALACLVACAAPRALAGDVLVTVKDAKGTAVADAVVSLVALDAPTAPAPTPPAEPVVIAQEGQEFDPYVTPVVAGTRVSFPNRDKIRHQVYSLSKTKPFEIPLYGPGAGQTIVFDKPGIVALGCNIHDWMSAYVVVLATPYFMKTPADGLARLAGLSPGRYRLDVWHPRLASETTREVVIAPADAATQTISVTLKPDKRIRRAPDSAGGGYK